MIVNIVLLLVGSIVFFSFVVQHTDDHQIDWTGNKKLSWDDYHATPEIVDSSNVALTYYGITCTMKTKGDSVTIIVQSIFDKSKSWVKWTDKTDSLLMHEQGHFDMAEVYARILKKTLQQKQFTKNTLSADFNQLYQKNSEKLNAYQSVYDDETDHGRNALKQAEWQQKIANQLNELNFFSNAKITTFLVR